MKKLLTLTALATVLMAAPAFAADDPGSKSESSVQSTANGGYESKDKSEKVDANGTMQTNEVTKKVDVDKDGHKDSSVDIKSTTDPKGLFNKHTVEIKNKASEDADKTSYKHKKIVNGSTVEENEDVKESAH